MACFGRATRVHTRRSLAARPHDRALRLAAKRVLKYLPVRFAGRQARAIGRGFASYVAKAGAMVWACSILPEHAHLVIARHRLDADRFANQLKGTATRRLGREGIHPMAACRTPGGRLPTPWARGQWAVFLNTPAQVRRAVEYVESNPMKEGLPPQRWPFVTPYDG